MNNLNETQNLNYEQKKNNGKGVFYGVIAVATLIVAIIGATFAYFTASANSSANALSATAAHVEVNYLEGRQLVATNLIPSKADVVRKAYARPTAYEKNVKAGCTHLTAEENKEANPESTTSASNWSCPPEVTAASTGDVGTKCVDDNGYYVCAVYQFTVTNTSNVKQALQAYMTINKNDFTTVDYAAASKQVMKDGFDPTTPVGDGWTAADAFGTQSDALETNHSNGALKFMTVRSGSVIDVTAIEEGDGCTSTLTFKPTQSVKSKMFCNASGGADVFDANTVDNSEDPAVVGRFSDTSGYYYYFNTTAVKQSLLASGTQAVFSGEILPSIDSSKLTSSNGILYMHTVSQPDTASITKIGPSDHQENVGTIYADTNGYVYNDENCTGKTYNATCHQVYLSASNQPSGEGDVVVGAYGQVSRTYYIVAWLEENNPNNTLYFDTNTLTSDASAKGRKIGDKLDQDVDQDKSFATTINVTSGSLGSAGITGTIDRES